MRERDMLSQLAMNCFYTEVKIRNLGRVVQLPKAHQLQGGYAPQTPHNIHSPPSFLLIFTPVFIKGERNAGHDGVTIDSK